MGAGTSVHAPYRMNYSDWGTYQGVRSLGAQGTPPGKPKVLPSNKFDINAFNTQKCSHRSFFYPHVHVQIGGTAGLDNHMVPRGGALQVQTHPSPHRTLIKPR